MAQSIPTVEPAFLVAGDSVSWRRSLADFPASAGWTLAYRLINAAGKIDITAAPDGDAYLVEESAASTAAWAAGEYAWQAYVTQGAERFTVGSGTLRIKPDLAAQAGGFDARSTARKALDDLRAALAAWVASNGHVNEADIGGRRVRFANAADIRARISMLEREVAREEAAERLAAGLPSGRRILVRF